MTLLAILTLLASANLISLIAIASATRSSISGRWVFASMVAPCVFGAALAVAVLA